MANRKIIEQILGKNKVEFEPRKKSSWAREFVNRCMNRTIFSSSKEIPSDQEISDNYKSFFGKHNVLSQFILEDLAEASGFFEYNHKADPIKEGRRQLFIYIKNRLEEKK